MNCHQGFRPTRKTGLCTTVVKCRGCALIYSNPQPIPASFDQHYGMAPDHYWQPSYFHFDPGYFSEQIKTFRSLYRVVEKPAALDIGAGIGKSMRALEASGFTAHALEPSEPFYQQAITRSGIYPDRLQLASLADAIFEPNSFDFISFGAVLEHIYDPAASICKALELAKPGALIQIEVPSSYFLTTKLLNLSYRLQGLDYVSNISPMHPPFHLYEFSPKSFLLHAQRAGYSFALSKFLPASTMLP